MCNTLESLRRLVVVWEQFHDYYLLQLLAEYFPWEGFWDKTISWPFLSGTLPLTGMRCFSEFFWEDNLFLDRVSQKQLTCDFCTSSTYSKVKETFGRFQLETPIAYKCKQILGLWHSSPQMENQCVLWKKRPQWGKKCIQHTERKK